jgi:hypothetical protein
MARARREAQSEQGYKLIEWAQSITSVPSGQKSFAYQIPNTANNLARQAVVGTVGLIGEGVFIVVDLGKAGTFGVKFAAGLQPPEPSWWSDTARGAVAAQVNGYNGKRGQDAAYEYFKDTLTNYAVKSAVFVAAAEAPVLISRFAAAPGSVLSTTERAVLSTTERGSLSSSLETTLTATPENGYTSVLSEIPKTPSPCAQPPNLAGQTLGRSPSSQPSLCPDAVSRSAALRAKYGQQFDEYMRYRGQGFTPAQAKYLTQPYDGMGHHFIARRYGLPSIISESPFNLLKPNGYSIGQF